MATYWKSQPRKFCDVCKCWIADNKASIEFHERGKSHKEKKEKQITLLRKKSQQQYKTDQKAGKYFQQMEKAALKKYKEDLRAQGIEVPVPEVEETTTSKHGRKSGYAWVNSYPKQQSNPPEPSNSKPQIVEPPKIVWTEQISPDDHTYYWNTETGKSQWEKPEKFVPLKKESEKSNSDSASKHEHPDDVDDNIPVVKRTKFCGDAYGGWTVVREAKPAKEIDLQLPKKPTNPVSEGLIDRTALEEEREKPVAPKFKEKVVVSLGGESGAVSFKKKGTTKQRSIRKRLED